MNTYEKIEKTFYRISQTDHIKAILEWDESVMMPTGGGESRANAMGELTKIQMELIQSPDLGAELKLAASQNLSLDDWQTANLREAQNAHNKAIAVDPDLVSRQTKATLACAQLWRNQRAENNWEDFKKPFAIVVALAKEEAKQRAAASGDSPYQTLVNIYEPGLQISRIEQAFTILKTQLPDLIQTVIEKQSSIPKIELGRKVPAAKQKAVALQFMKWQGFDFQHGRLDESHHPFCGGVPKDVRLTAKYSEDQFLSGLMAILHETGHAMYQQGLPEKWIDQPVGAPRGMAFHESQSLFMEMQIARSREFAEFALPILVDGLSEKEDPTGFWTVDNIYRHIINVEKGFIRIEADEVTYPIHVILRYELEKALIEGNIKTEDLPHLWDEKMKTYLSVDSKGNHKDGCMQDVHWPLGIFGYFPSYTLGALIAAQLFSAMSKKIPTVRNDIQNGRITPITNWLNQNIWSLGSKYESEKLLELASGEPLNVDHYLNHIQNRYLRQ